ncbi:MAG: cell envelope integrity protein CreD [Bacteroidia bacterium]|nr:cell envelope integrity protein CreD [Bacteroidia bacterium]
MKIEISDNKKWQYSLTLKIILLSVMGLFLLIPLEMIKSIIKERQQNSEKVKQEIALQWAGKQNVSGPILNIPVRIIPGDEKAPAYKRVYHIMPEMLNISGTVQTEKRNRSIYKAVVYNSLLEISGEFMMPEINPDQKSEILWEEAYFTLGISDNRGVKGSAAMKAGTLLIDAVPGLKDTEVFNSGISFPVALGKSEKTIPFELNLTLSGSEDLSFSPAGKTTNVSLSSPWDSPGFNGNFLPSSRTIDASGFKASWLITNLNRNFPQMWAGSEFKPANDSFGVEFVLLADHYQKSLRSAKYGILFIALTFLALLFAEMSTGENLHIISYLLVSLALVLFFSLLNALSEHLGFNPAYIIAAASTIIMIFLFLRKLVKNYRPVFLITGLLVILYSFIFILLTLNDYAYLAGNIGLFVLLSVTMGISVRLKIFRTPQDKEI